MYFIWNDNETNLLRADMIMAIYLLTSNLVIVYCFDLPMQLVCFVEYKFN